MRPIGIILVAVSLGAIIAIIGGSNSNQDEVGPWVGLNCDEMIDFSGSDEHQSMGDSMHMEFHNYYFDHCSETEFGKP